MLTSPIMYVLYRIEDFVLGVLRLLGVPSSVQFQVLPLLEGLLSSLALAFVVAVPVLVFLFLVKLIWRYSYVNHNS